MIVQISAITSLAGIVFSLIFLGRQTRELAKQTKINNRIGILSGLHDALELLQSTQIKLFENPEFYAYFYGGEPLPPSGEKRMKIEALTEMWVDSIEYSLTVLSLPPKTHQYDGLKMYALYMYMKSPSIKKRVDRNLDSYQRYAEIINDQMG